MKTSTTKQSPNTCIKENCQRPVFIKKRSLCDVHYRKLVKNARGQGKSLVATATLSVPTVRIYGYKGEIEFIKNYFNHSNWIHQPGMFRLDGTLYHPDFYDGEREVFIEVSATRQAYHKSKHKYQLFRDTFPGLTLEIRKPSGELLNETSPIDWQ